ncbi:sensor histidine kinase [Burkholderia cepacia]|uniref:sensor histidine kinase n=1 Tax=Burkholderia cepacia TaxID=292 RepID=UPI0009BECDA6|nr:ATP-binding protein [Burkholderia cepacia]
MINQAKSKKSIVNALSARVRDRVARCRRKLRRTLLAREPESYSTIILYLGGVTLTFVSIAGACLIVESVLDAHVEQSIMKFDTQVSVINLRLGRSGAFYDRLAKLYEKRPAPAPGRHDSKWPERRQNGSAAQSAHSGCLMNFHVSGGPDSGVNDFACATPMLRTLWQWLHACATCQKGSLIIFDRAGRYLSEMSDRPRQRHYHAQAYIAKRTAEFRQVFADRRRSDTTNPTGMWLAPDIDPVSGEYRFVYVKPMTLPDDTSAVLVRALPIDTLLNTVLPNESRGTLLLASASESIDLSMPGSSTTKRYTALAEASTTAVERHHIRWVGTSLYISRPTPIEGWTWVQEINAQQLALAVWRSALAVIAPLAGFVAIVWITITWFEMRVLAPIKRQAVRGRESAKFQQAMAEALPTAFATLDPISRRFVIRNRRARELLRQPGRTAVVASLVAHLERHDFSIEPSFSIDMKIDEDDAHQLYEFVLRRTEHAGTATILMTIHDMTERHLTERQLLSAKSAAEEAGRAKDGYLALMDNAIRIPLHDALSGLEALEIASAAPADRERVATIRRAISSLLELFDSTSPFSATNARLLHPKPSSFSVRTMIERIVQSVRPLIGARDIRINYRVADHDSPVTTDELLLHQVVLNLVHNALKFTSRGKIEIRCQAETDAAGNGHLSIDVEDTGPGIPPGELENIFQPYVQSQSSTNRTPRGTGLGLALCKKICALLGGSICARSAPGSGSTFSLRVPVTWADRPATPYAWPSPDSRRVVMLLDRNEMPNDLPDVLAEAGWSVDIRFARDIRPSGPETSGAARILVTRHAAQGEHWPRIDLIIADDGPLDSMKMAGTWVISAYSFEALRQVWPRIARQA